MENMLNRSKVAILVSFFFITNLAAEPWVDTRNALLRSDIERLSNAGIIKTPIKTWPLMWASILDDIDNANILDQPQSIVNSFVRVKKAGEHSAQVGRVRQTVELSLANDSQVIRHFGKSARDQGQLTIRQQGLRQHIAYNFEVTQVQDPWDNDKSHYDNSYLAMVLGNWVLGLGAIERWWGPGWKSSLILSNNARPTTSLFIQRNYSDAFALPILRHLGPWTASGFISKLDDDRHINNAKLLGLTVGFKPTQDFEINLRRTAQWGGDGRPQSFDNFIKLLTGSSDNCETLICRQDEPGNQLGAIDISWTMPFIDTTFYVQTVGEDESGYLPSRSSRQWGVERAVNGLGFTGMFFFEYDNTTTVTQNSRSNYFYNHHIYQTGYRYGGRAIGATWDNDSKITSLGFAGYLKNGDGFQFDYSSGELNIDSIDGSVSKHSISPKGGEFSRFSVKWQRSFTWGDVYIGGEYNDRLIDEYGRQTDKLKLDASFEYKLF